MEEWFDSEKYRKKLVKLTKESQLTFLKHQISPHFLFNTLNTVYALSLKKSEQTGKTLNKLKEVIHYMELVEKSDTITLKEEISYLESVIALHSLRTEFHEKIKLNINCSEKCLAKKIHSMLSISFIENAFKHGRLNKPEDYIIINITSKETNVLFEVKNSTNNNFSSKDNAHGIGIENVKQRLSILYPNYNCLKITSTDTFYKTNLSLEYIN